MSLTSNSTKRYSETTLFQPPTTRITTYVGSFHDSYTITSRKKHASNASYVVSYYNSIQLDWEPAQNTCALKTFLAEVGQNKKTNTGHALRHPLYHLRCALHLVIFLLKTEPKHDYVRRNILQRHPLPLQSSKPSHLNTSNHPRNGKLQLVQPQLGRRTSQS